MSKPLRNTLILVLISCAGLALWLNLHSRENQTRPATTPQLGVTVLSYGGAFADAQRKAYFKPFTDTSKIVVTEDTYDGEYGKLKAAVDSRAVPWDVMDIESSALLRGTRDQLFEKIDYDKVSTTGLLPEAIDPYAVATDFYSVSLGFNTKRFPSGSPQPQTWRDFWDAERFPGPRSLKKDPRFTLEIALLADGVPLKDLYASGDLDVERAFRSLDRIKKNITVWWTTGQQPVQLLADGELAMAAAFGARMYNAAYVEKKPIEMTWNEGIIDIEYWVIPRHAKSPQAALAFINFASSPKAQADFALAFPLGPVNQKAFEHLSPEIASRINSHPSNLKRQAFLNAKYWATHEEQLRERFNTWLAK